MEQAEIKTFVPWGDRVLVRTDPQPTTTAGGIHVPDTAKREDPVRGEIVAVGSGLVVDGKVVESKLQVGDRVLYDRMAFVHRLGPCEVVMRESEIIGLISWGPGEQ